LRRKEKKEKKGAFVYQSTVIAFDGKKSRGSALEFFIFKSTKERKGGEKTLTNSIFCDHLEDNEKRARRKKGND